MVLICWHCRTKLLVPLGRGSRTCECGETLRLVEIKDLELEHSPPGAA